MTAAVAGGGRSAGEAGTSPPAVLVTDGEQRSALAAVRSLGQAGYRVYVSAQSRRSVAGASRWAAGAVVVPDALSAADAFASAVVSQTARHHIRVVLPMTDAAMLALLPVRDRLVGATIPFGTLEAFRRLADKAALRSAALTAGIAFPAQVELTWEERDTQSVAPLRWPAVVKPARSVGDVAEGRAKFAVRHTATPEQLRTVVASFPQGAFPLLIQERIVGPGVGVFLLIWDGRVVSTFAHRRLREKPPAGGVSVYAESVAAPPDLIDRSRALMHQLGWQGVAMVEYKIDAATGTPYLMEINGRFWGTLQLAIDAGVDFPRLLVDLALGRRSSPAAEYRVGVRNRWWWGDVDHLLARVRRSAADLSLPPDAPSRLAAVTAFFRRYHGDQRDVVYRREDPKPFVRETWQWVRGR